MRSRLLLITIVVAMLGTMVLAQGQRRQRLNPMVDLLEQKKASFGLSPPSVAPPANAAGGGGRGEGRGGGAAAAAEAVSTVPDMCGVVPTPPAPRGEGGNAARGGGGAGGRGEGRGGGGGAARGGGGGAAPANALPQPQNLAEAAKMALGYKGTDFLYNGSMEGGVTDARINAYTAFMTAMKDAGAVTKTPYAHLTHPLVLKTPSIAEIPDGYIQALSKQLNAGTSGLMFVDVDCAKELSAGLAAMRFRSKGGTRPEDVGMAPSYWGLTEAQYKQKADVWPLNPDGELVNWTIIESREGLKNLRSIAAVKGLGVLWPGAGTLRGVLANDPDPNAHEKAIQSVLAACKEFNVACGFPVSSPTEVERRLKEGFTVLLSQSWSQASMDTLAAGRKAAGRPPTN